MNDLAKVFAVLSLVVIWFITVIGISSIIPMILSGLILWVFPNISYSFWQLVVVGTCINIFLSSMWRRK